MDADNRLRLRMLGVFVLQGILPASFNLRIPDLQLAIGLSDSALGFALMGGPIGALLSFPIAARIVNHFGTRLSIAASYLIGTVFGVLLFFATEGMILFSIFLIIGATYSLSNIAINVEADRVELRTGRRLMSLCHGMWSIVFMASSGLSGVIRGLGIAPLPHVAATAAVVVLLILVFVLPMNQSPAREVDAKPSRRLVRPTVAVLWLVAFGLGGDLLEGASRVWATIFMRDAFDVSPFVESMALFSLIAAMAVSRLLADRFIEAHGPQRIGRLALGVTFVGVVLLVAASSPILALCGFALAGFGAGVVYPLMISSAARLKDRPAEENVASITFVFQTLMLFAPMLVGLISESFGVRSAYGLLLPLLLLGWWAAGRLPRQG